MTLPSREMDVAQEELKRLAELGLHISGDDETEVRAQCMRIARRLLSDRAKVIGFLPTTDRIGVPPVAIQLGLSIVELSGATAAYVDANVRYPALAQLSAERTESDEQMFHTRWLMGSLALLTPYQTEKAGEAVPALASLLVNGADLFEHILVDLTGFELLGEHASAAACMDGVVLVAHTHKTKEREVLRFINDMPKSRLLGVLLVG